MSSIEAKYKEKLEQIETIKKSVLEKQNELEILKRQREKEKELKRIFDLDQRIHKLEDAIKEDSKVNQIEYMMQVCPLLNEYCVNDEKSEFEKIDTLNFGNFVEKRYVNNRGELFNQYMEKFEDIPIRQKIETNSALFCTNCNTEWTISNNDSTYICKNCGEYETYFETNSNGLTYEQEISTDTNVNFAYKRINHLREILAQIQAKETSNIPNEVLDALRTEFKKTRITDLSEITQDKVRFYLKKLKFNRYYENCRQITNILNGKPPPTISEELYEKIMTLFSEIQEPYERACPSNRKNFFSYNYILYKFCELLDEQETMQLFPLLKSREKLYQQDCIWKKICEINDWPFYKSV